MRASRSMGAAVDIRPMRAGDAAACTGGSDEAFREMRGRYHLPVHEQTPELAARYDRRFQRFVETDPEGSWIAEAEEGVVGMAQAIVRDGLWLLSMLAVTPTWQDRRVGRDL